MRKTFRVLRKQHSNPPHPTAAQLQPLSPSPARAETHFPFHGVRRPAGGNLPVPASPKSGIMAVKLLLPSSSHSCPTPASPSIPCRAGDPLFSPGSSSPPSVPALPAPGGRGNEGMRRHRVRSGGGGGAALSQRPPCGRRGGRGARGAGAD